LAAVVVARDLGEGTAMWLALLPWGLFTVGLAALLGATATARRRQTRRDEPVARDSRIVNSTHAHERRLP
jgi:hypothetical protein